MGERDGKSEKRDRTASLGLPSATGASRAGARAGEVTLGVTGRLTLCGDPLLAATAAGSCPCDVSSTELFRRPRVGRDLELTLELVRARVMAGCAAVATTLSTGVMLMSGLPVSSLAAASTGSALDDPIDRIMADTSNDNDPTHRSMSDQTGKKKWQREENDAWEGPNTAAAPGRKVWCRRTIGWPCIVERGGRCVPMVR